MNGEDAGGFISPETPPCTICAPVRPPATDVFLHKETCLTGGVERRDGPRPAPCLVFLFFPRRPPYKTLAAMKQLTSCPRRELLITNLQWWEVPGGRTPRRCSFIAAQRRAL